MRNHHLHLLGLLLAFALSALIYSVATPLFEAPDEVWHYAYVRYVVETHTLPALTDSTSGAYQEVAQPPLYYVTAALVSGLVADEDLQDLMWHNPGFGYQAEGTVNDNKNMLIHTQRENLPWQGAVLAIRLARFVSLAFGLLTVIAAWGLGHEAFPRQPSLALGAAGVVAFIPQFLFISGVVSNDSAAAALSTSTLWAIARTVNRGATGRRSIIVGLLVGLAALTKTSCLLLGLPAVIGLMFSSSHHTRRASHIVACLALFAIAASSVGGWWYVRNAVVYRDPLALQVHIDTPWGRTTTSSLTTLLTELPKVYRSFWAGFGWGHVEYPRWTYLMLATGPLVSLIGWAWAWKRKQFPGRERIFLLAMLWWLLVFAALLQWMRQVEAPHGRLLFPAIGAGTLLLVGGWASLPKRHPMPIFLTALIGLSTLTPWVVVRPAFTPPRLIQPSRIAETVQGPTLVYDNTIRLLGVAMDRTSIEPGETLHVRVCWEALTPMNENYTVFVHLIGRNNQRVGERYTYPGLGRFPTSLWQAGDAFCDTYRVPVENWAPVPEMYDLVVGMYDTATGERLVIRDSGGAVVDIPSVAQVRIAPQQPIVEMPQVALDYELGDQIALVGFQLSDPIQSNATLTVTLYWQAIAPPTGDYTVFVHLLNKDGLVAQHDGPPRYGRYPTSDWRTGDMVPDEHRLELPTLVPGQFVRLVVGMYRVDTLERLPAIGPDGPVIDNIIPLPLEPQ